MGKMDEEYEYKKKTDEEQKTNCMKFVLWMTEHDINSPQFDDIMDWFYPEDIDHIEMIVEKEQHKMGVK